MLDDDKDNVNVKMKCIISTDKADKNILNGKTVIPVLFGFAGGVGLGFQHHI